MTNYVLYSGQLNTQEKYLLSEIVYIEVYGFIHIDILIFLLCEISAYLKWRGFVHLKKIFFLINYFIEELSEKGQRGGGRWNPMSLAWLKSF